ncbi:MAG: hypothetical protein NTY00_09040 [Deltaproteobacteria bacterium]|nr:hypothetical protein [Deltaproteobacteria bacterium]
MEHKYIIPLDDQLYGINYSDEDHLLFVFMGHTLTEIQVFESMLCFTLSAIMKDSEAKANFEESMQSNASKTLGQIANIIKTHLNDDNLANLLIEVKNKRNYFVHGFLKNYGWPMMGKQKYAQALEEMEKLQEQLKETHVQIGKHVAENNLAKIGFATISKDGDIEVIATSGF